MSPPFDISELDRAIEIAELRRDGLRDDGVLLSIATRARQCIMEMTGDVERWHKAYYREERRATEYHNADQIDSGFKCGHPVSCIRNGPVGTGARCLMCEQDKRIAELEDSLAAYADAGDGSLKDWAIALDRAEKAEARIAELTAEVTSLKFEIVGLNKAAELMNKGFESTCELSNTMKQELRKLKAAT